MGEAGDSKAKNIRQIFETMDYGNELESITEATEWIKETKKLGGFAYIDKATDATTTLKNAFNNDDLGNVHVPESTTVEAVLGKVAKAKNTWIEISVVKRVEIIAKLAAEILKHQNIFIQLEIAARGILAKDTKNKALPLLTDYLQFYSTLAVTSNGSNTPKGLAVAILPDHNSLWTFGCTLGPYLSSGQRLILQTGPQLSLAATLLIQLAVKVGVPENTITLIPGDVVPNTFFLHSDVGSISIFDDLCKERYLFANHFHKKLFHFNSSGTSMLVFDGCDLDSACHSVVDAVWGYKGMLQWSTRNIFVQENIFDKFTSILKQKLLQTKVKKSNTKNVDISPPEDKVLDEIRKTLEKAKKEGVEIFQPNEDTVIPILFLGGHTFPNNVIKEDLNLPLATLVPFRTINEAVALCNNTRQGLGTSVWTESTSLVNEIIDKIKVANIWINSHGLFAPNVPVSPFKSSSNGYLGGHEGFLESVKINPLSDGPLSQVPSAPQMEKAINEAKKAQEAWSKLTRFERIKHLQTLTSKMESNEEFLKILCDYSMANSGEAFTKYKTFNCVTTREPRGIVAIEADDTKETQRLIILALLEGNAVIALNEETKEFYEFVSQGLPKGVFTVVIQSLDVVKVAALHKELNLYVGRKVNKVFGSLSLKTSCKFRVAGSSWKEALSAVTLVKNVWLNKGQSIAL